jgi:8-oxo-dGTP diphosphatase
MSHPVTPSIAVTTDVVLLCMHQHALHILLVQRKYPPFAGQWALPGGFVEAGETLAAAAQRELREETGVHDIYVAQIGAFGDPHRDPRRHTVSIAFLGLCPAKLTLTPSDETPRVAWFPLAQLPTPLAFDHDHIIQQAHIHLANAIITQPIALHLVDAPFTIDSIWHIYQHITGRALDRTQFGNHLIQTGAVTPVPATHMYRRAPADDATVFFMPWPDWCT